MLDIKLVMTGVIGINTQASITVRKDENWSVELQSTKPGGNGELVTMWLSPEMIAELQGLLRRAGVGRKKKADKQENADV